jgi:hypothetical protein
LSSENYNFIILYKKYIQHKKIEYSHIQSFFNMMRQEVSLYKMNGERCGPGCPVSRRNKTKKEVRWDD